MLCIVIPGQHTGYLDFDFYILKSMVYYNTHLAKSSLYKLTARLLHSVLCKKKKKKINTLHLFSSHKLL